MEIVFPIAIEKSKKQMITPKISEYNPVKKSVETNRIAKNTTVKNIKKRIVIWINKSMLTINTAKYIRCV